MNKKIIYSLKKIFSRITIFSAALTAALHGCSGAPLKENLEIIEIYGFKELPWDELPEQVREPEYIRLKSVEHESMLGNIDDIKFSGGKIYVKDWSNKRLAVFTAHGEWNGSISRRGRGPGEYLNISDFDVSSDGDIYIIDGTADKMLVYNSEFRCIRDIALPFEIDNLKVIDPDKYLIAVASWENGEFSGTQLMTSDSLFNKREEISRYTEYFDDNFWLSSSFIVTSEEGFFFHRHVNDSVYNISSNGELEKIYFFDMGSSSVPLKKRNNIGELFESGELKNYSALITFTVVGKKYIYGMMYDKGKRVMFIADRDAGTIYKLPAGKSGKYGIFKGCSHGTVISVIPPGVADDYLPERGDDFIIGLYRVR